MWWMWRHADFPKAAFQQAEQANQGRGSVPFPANVILPTRPPTLTEAAGPAKKHGHRQQLPGFQVVVPAQQAAQGNTDPDAFPWAFWPQLPWDRDPDDIYDELRAPDESIARFMRGETQRKDADETGWVGVLSLGQGAYGRAGLWVQIDDSRNITDVSLENSART